MSTFQKIQGNGFLENVITNEEYQCMLDYTLRHHSRKYYCLIRSLALTGARVSEITKFRVEHIAIGHLDIPSKGNKIRRIYLPERLCDELRQ